ncbi:alpha/beta hydrolase [Oceanicoccus sp. KOV_DT_Chl]|uniref:alpha/beta hydrolase n=1 Tax=Oceanicoccus sp. KOV_DT_Chl TaxID=1904639 RepID=UPI000C7DF7BF|nr:alpha/beta hydrolase [Oceanicoccus sp. KOV_DT_Chl]
MAVTDAVVVIADYRRYPEVLFASIMQDATAVVSWVHKNITTYGGNANQLVLMGHSSGAHMAAMLTLNESYLPVEHYAALKGFIGLAGPYDFLPLTRKYQRALFAPEVAFPSSQPVNFVSGTEPPLLLLYGEADDTVKRRNIDSLTATVKQRQGRVDSLFYAELTHTGILAALSVPLRNSSSVHTDILRFINRVATDN